MYGETFTLGLKSEAQVGMLRIYCKLNATFVLQPLSVTLPMLTSADTQDQAVALLTPPKFRHLIPEC
jgi:hypothetical protein